MQEELLETHLALRAADSTSSPRTGCGGLYALDRGRRQDHARAVEIHRRAAARALEEGDSLDARFQTAVVELLEGYARWKDGDPRRALPLLEDAVRQFDCAECMLWIGQIYLELDRPAEAIPYFRAIRFNPLADYYLGMAFEQAGEYGEARQAYESLVVNWRDADAELQPMVERARQGMVRVSGLRRE